MRVSVQQHRFALKRRFTISRGSRTEAQVLVASVERDGAVGRGECVPYSRYGESMASVASQIKSVKPPFDRNSLQEILAPGAARNALDCALWDLDAKLAGTTVWKLAGGSEPKPVTTAYTISLAEPDDMRADAAAHSDCPLLKVKLGGEAIAQRLEAVRAGAPNARIIVDANEAWNTRILNEAFEFCRKTGVEMVEQPLPANHDGELGRFEAKISVCADESCHDRESLAQLRDRYSVVNIKLDKTGGLTEALALKKQAIQEGFDVMVGCMIGSSLAMAPAIIVAQDVQFVDLDGPLHMAEDHHAALRYDGCRVFPPKPELWG